MKSAIGFFLTKFWKMIFLTMMNACLFLPTNHSDHRFGGEPVVGRIQKPLVEQSKGCKFDETVRVHSVWACSQNQDQRESLSIWFTVIFVDAAYGRSAFDSATDHHWRRLGHTGKVSCVCEIVHPKICIYTHFLQAFTGKIRKKYAAANIEGELMFNANDMSVLFNVNDVISGGDVARLHLKLWILNNW